jgi:hypothetical protein
VPEADGDLDVLRNERRCTWSISRSVGVRGLLRVGRDISHLQQVREVLLSIRVHHAVRYCYWADGDPAGGEGVNVEGGLRACQHGTVSGSSKCHIDRSYHLLTIALRTH